jgi:hypothetical protein
MAGPLPLPSPHPYHARSAVAGFIAFVLSFDHESRQANVEGIALKVR